MFGIPWASATAFSIPATYATAYAFIYAYGKLFVAMASSKLLPSVVGLRSEVSETPYAGLIAGSLVGYGICLLVFYVPWIGHQLFNICILSAFMAYIAQCIGYILLQYKYSNLAREFRSPLGIPGAVYSILVWTLGIVSVIGFQGDKQFALIVFVCVCLLSTLFYFSWSKNRQTFSDDECKILFVAHVVNCEFLHSDYFLTIFSQSLNKSHFALLHFSVNARRQSLIRSHVHPLGKRICMIICICLHPSTRDCVRQTCVGNQNTALSVLSLNHVV